MSDVGQTRAQDAGARRRAVPGLALPMTTWATGSIAQDNSNIEVDLLAQNLRARGYDDGLINKAIAELKKAASLGGGRDLYEANRDVYGLLRYGVKVKPGWASSPRRSG